MSRAVPSYSFIAFPLCYISLCIFSIIPIFSYRCAALGSTVAQCRCLETKNLLGSLPTCTGLLQAYLFSPPAVADKEACAWS